jgi:oxygen-dependent protoporphyrinogen oxidase
VLPGPLSGPDVAVGPFIRKRFGSEVLERMVDPILAGTRAGDPDKLSLSACMPQIDQAARAKRSVMSGLPRASGPPPFLAPKGGMSRLIDALAASLEDTDVRMNQPVRAVHPGADGYRLTLDDGEIDARSLVLAVPAPAAADLVHDFAPDAAQGLRELTHASVAAVTLVYPSGALTLPSGTSGFLVPNEAGRLLSAGTWWSLKWPDSTPPDRTVVRAFVGRSSGDAAVEDDDEALIEKAAREIARLVGTRAGHVAGAVHRWPKGLPQYEVGHAERIEGIERALYPHPGVILAGADYRGTGIPDCVRQGRAAAGAAIESLQGARGRKRTDGR